MDKTIKFQDIIIWILFVLSIIIFLWFVFGNSPTFEQTILVLSVTFLFTLGFKLGGFGARLEHMERRFDRLEEGFIKLVSDFKEVKEKVNKLK